MDDESPLPPCLPAVPSFKICRGRVINPLAYEPFFTASQVKKNKMLAEIEKLGRKKDAATFLIEARMDLWDIRPEPDYGDTKWDYRAYLMGKTTEEN